jgi:hypothetical protein
MAAARWGAAGVGDHDPSSGGPGLIQRRMAGVWLDDRDAGQAPGPGRLVIASRPISTVASARGRADRAALTSDLGITPDQVAEYALRYVLARPAVSTVIAGMRTVRNVERNAALDDGPDLTQEQVAALAGHRWEKNFYVA